MYDTVYIKPIDTTKDLGIVRRLERLEQKLNELIEVVNYHFNQTRRDLDILDDRTFTGARAS